MGTVASRLHGAIRTSIATLGFLAAGSAMGQANTPTVDTVWARTLQRVQFGVLALTIRAGTNPDGSPNEGAGSAFAIGGTPGPYYVVTTAHVLPDRTANISIEALNWPAFAPKTGPVALQIKAVERAQLTDLAVLTPPESGPLAYRALPTLGEAPALGTEVAILGHPQGSSSEFVPAYVSGQGPDGTIKLTGIVEEGYSGAPVFDRDGNVVCIVRGGEPVADVPPEKKVMGKALCTPVRMLLSRWEFQPFRDATSAVTTKRTQGRDLVQADYGKPTLTLAKTIEVTKDDHPIVFAPHRRSYTEVLQIPAGFRAVTAEFTPWSATRAKYTIERSSDKVTLNFELTSGPLVDQYRGWLKGKLVVTVESIQ